MENPNINTEPSNEHNLSKVGYERSQMIKDYEINQPDLMEDLKSPDQEESFQFDDSWLDVDFDEFIEINRDDIDIQLDYEP